MTFVTGTTKAGQAVHVCVEDVSAFELVGAQDTLIVSLRASPLQIIVKDRERARSLYSSLCETLGVTDGADIAERQLAGAAR